MTSFMSYLCDKNILLCFMRQTADFRGWKSSGAYTSLLEEWLTDHLPPPTDTSLYRKALIGDCKPTSILVQANSRSSQKPEVHCNPELVPELLLQESVLDLENSWPTGT